MALLGHPPAFDAWWLVYPVTSHIPAHTDPSPADGLAHVRVNVVVARAEGSDAEDAGGVLVADGAPVPLQVGDAVVFRPDVVEHAVTAVSLAPRCVLSVGTVVAPDDAAATMAGVGRGVRRFTPLTHRAILRHGRARPAPRPQPRRRRR